MTSFLMTHNFYDRIFIGGVGLPRQLFYSVIGGQFRNLTSPENSALFYHLVAMKLNPWTQKLLFRKFNDTEHSGNGPKFIETQYLRCDRRSKRKLIKWEWYGDDVVMESCFIDIEKYYKLQKTYKDRGFDKWTTPSLVDVARILGN
ncbi:hypothetical protein CRE_17606 [Caenorhabditis remanei]|uniref:Uncharacterized protein n=1 Tax=Caenorhabditis remanei TaxID=31234 RepID=E3NHA3_CAERE|nr:hypothetical protein CRE_17606 [Caenorhabditis remanei]